MKSLTFRRYPRCLPVRSSRTAARRRRAFTGEVLIPDFIRRDHVGCAWRCQPKAIQLLVIRTVGVASGSVRALHEMAEVRRVMSLPSSASCNKSLYCLITRATQTLHERATTRARRGDAGDPVVDHGRCRYAAALHRSGVQRRAGAGAARTGGRAGSSTLAGTGFERLVLCRRDAGDLRCLWYSWPPARRDPTSDRCNRGVTPAGRSDD